MSESLSTASVLGRTTLRLQAELSVMQIVRFQEKEAVKFVTPSGVTAVIATSLHPDLLKALRKKLQHKLKRRGLLPVVAKR